MVVYYHGQPMNSVEGLASNVWYEEANQSQTNLQTKITNMVNSTNSVNTKVTNKVKYNGAAVNTVNFQLSGTTLTITTS